uniref:Uncharacterized protein n=1 Tax=Glossina palpalis gambiensis TaxID=67801 RepID=A0A1B0BY94_9MUSC
MPEQEDCTDYPSQNKCYDSTVDWGTFALLLFDKPPGTRDEHLYVASDIYVNCYFEGVNDFLNESPSLALCPKGVGNEVRFKMVVSICRFCESLVLSARGANVKLIPPTFKLLLASVLKGACGSESPGILSKRKGSAAHGNEVFGF